MAARQAVHGHRRGGVRYLSLKEVTRLVNACEPVFRPLVQGALATGCRYGELARLEAQDFDAKGGTLHVRQSKSGKPRRVVLTAEGVELFQRLCAGRASGELLFTMPNGQVWGRSCQDKFMARACERARIKPPATFHCLRHTWASLSIMAGMPLAVAAKNLGHSSIKMVEAHYGHLAPDYIAQQVRQSAPVFGFKPDTKVAALRG